MPTAQGMYEQLVADAVELLNKNQSDQHLRAVAAMSCLGFCEGSVLSASVIAQDGDTALPLVMVLSVLRACKDAEVCPQTRALLNDADETVQRAIARKVGLDCMPESLH